MGAEGKFDGPHEHVVVNGSGDIEQSQGSNAADVSCLEAVKRRGTSFSSSFEMFIAGMGGKAVYEAFRTVYPMSVPHAMVHLCTSQ